MVTAEPSIVVLGLPRFCDSQPERGSFDVVCVDHRTDEIIGTCIEVHEALGPGLLESTYEACLARELQVREIPFSRQVVLPLEYKGLRVARAFKADLVVRECVVIEVKAVHQLLAVHRAQLRTYLRLTGIEVGLLVNFNVTALRDGGIRRVVPA